MDGRKRSSCFAITINHIDWTKDCVAEYFTATGDINRLVVAEEFYHPPLDCVTGEPVESNERHNHIFVEFKEKYFCTEVRTMVEDFVGGEDFLINIQVK